MTEKCKAYSCNLPSEDLSQFPNEDFKCELGYKHYPRTKDAAARLVKNNGFHTICKNNPWKYLKVE